MYGLERALWSTALIVSTALSVGCTAQLTVMSQPEGAYIAEVGTGKPIGIAPVNVNYDPASLAQFASGGCFIVKGFEAHWTSGAVSTMSPVRLCGSNFGDYNITLNRDSSYPGLDKDLQFAIQVQTLRAQKQAAQDASEAALLSAGQAKNVNCTTTLMGPFADTNCK